MGIAKLKEKEGEEEKKDYRYIWTLLKSNRI
jgi:hypothetical protein